ncbi:MAG: glycoside hydrolase family 43 protein [Verrucomicrobiota bacterium]
MLKITLLAAALLPLAPTLHAADAADTSTWVRFSSFSYNGKTATAPKAGEYLNPVVAGFYPDPSICRVGDDYYLANSAFNYFPGIPIWHSKDLVNWTQIGNVIDRPSQFAMHGGAVSAGTYAPTIRYHNGTFYLVCTFVGGIGNFYVTAKDPTGPWSEPVHLRSVGGMDPSFFFDDDGKCYIVNCDDPVGQPKYNGHRTIRLQEVDLDQKKPVGEKTVLVDGGTDISKHPVWCEGPHLYKINKTYYLMCAQGGTGTAHSEVIFKSDSLRGPYVPGPNNPMITARDLPANRPNPVTCTGHADMVQTQNGDWFAVFLGCQPYQAGFYNTGRQTFLLPVKWENGWPSILLPGAPVPLTVKKPNLPADKPVATPTTGDMSFTDNFDSDTLAFRWVGLRAPASKWHEASKAAKALFLEPRADRFSGQGNPSYLAVRQQNNDFACCVTLTVQPNTSNCVAGLAAFQNEGHYYAINVTIDSGHLTEISVGKPAGGRGFGGGGDRGAQPGILTTQKLPDNLVSIDLKIEGAGPVTRCFYKTGNGDFTQLGQDLQSSFLSTDTAGGFQGVTLGMFAHN